MRLYGGSFLVNQMKINIASKNFFFNIRYNRQMKPMLTLLTRLNLIRRYFFINTSYIRIFPNWVGERSTLKKVRFFQKNPPLNLTLRSLKILNTHTFNSLIILSTPRGLITHKEALRFRTGGLLVCLLL